RFFAFGTPARYPRTPRAVVIYPRAVALEPRAVGVVVEAQLVDERLSRTAVPHHQVFHFFQAAQMQPQLCVAPARVLAHGAPRETILGGFHLQALTLFLGHLL